MEGHVLEQGQGLFMIWTTVTWWDRLLLWGSCRVRFLGLPAACTVSEGSFPCGRRAPLQGAREHRRGTEIMGAIGGNPPHLCEPGRRFRFQSLRVGLKVGEYFGADGQISQLSTEERQPCGLNLRELGLLGSLSVSATDSMDHVTSTFQCLSFPLCSTGRTQAWVDRCA